MSDLVLYTNPRSRGRIARWMLEEIGEPYRTEIVAYGPPMKEEVYLRINPMGKIPALVHGERVVTECAAICAYLADAFPAAGLAPAPDQRAAYYRWMFFAAGPVEQATTLAALGIDIPEDKRGFVGTGDIERVARTMAGAIGEGPWVLGEHFSAVDVYFGAQVLWGLRFRTLPSISPLKAYADRLKAREAYRRATALDDASEGAA